MFLLVLFTADVVQAAPAELMMQLPSQSVSHDMPCHAGQGDPQQDQSPDYGQCHACFACVKLGSAPAELVLLSPARPSLVAHPQPAFQTCFTVPALRPPIFS